MGLTLYEKKINRNKNYRNRYEIEHDILQTLIDNNGKSGLTNLYFKVNLSFSQATIHIEHMINDNLIRKEQSHYRKGLRVKKIIFITEKGYRYFDELRRNINGKNSVEEE